MKILSESFVCKEDKRHGVIAGKRSGAKGKSFSLLGFERGRNNRREMTQ